MSKFEIRRDDSFRHWRDSMRTSPFNVSSSISSEINELDADEQFRIASNDGPFSLSAPQVPIWIDQALYRNKPVYNTGQTLILRTALDTKCFVEALERTVAENDSLRLRFVQHDSDILQHSVRDVPVHLEFSDFTGDRNPEGTATAWIEQLFWQPLEPTDFPLFQFALAKVAKDHFLWFQKYHHLIIDAIGRRFVASSCVYLRCIIGRSRARSSQGQPVSHRC